MTAGAAIIQDLIKEAIQEMMAITGETTGITDQTG
jgi:hypothetical protein